MSADNKAAAAWDDYVSQQQEEKIEELERELNAANQRIQRLEKAGDAMAEWLENPRNLGADACLSHAWREAKEGKP